MCLIIVAHCAASHSPLVIAANRDEDRARPSRAAHFWDDAPGVFGGRDLLAGGSWLAVTRGGRFAAVTNLRGSAKRPDSLSRGALVAGFVTADVSPLEYASRIDPDAYAGFHLLAGVAGQSIAWLATGMRAPAELPHGIHGFSNGPPGARWAKVERGIAAMRAALDGKDVIPELLRFLGTPSPGARIEESVFVTGERYGTRSSTAIVMGSSGIAFAEQNWSAGGVPAGDAQLTQL
jgi:uncharacterized protein with NRDE domain